MFIELTFARSAAVALVLISLADAAQNPVIAIDPPQFGPYNASFLPDGPGLTRPIADAHDPILLANSPWSLSCWIRTAEPVDALELVAGVGSPNAERPRYLAIDSGRVALWMGNGSQLSGSANLKPGEWHLLVATFDGTRFPI